MQIVPGDATDTYQSCLPIQVFRLSITAAAVGGDSITMLNRAIHQSPNTSDLQITRSHKKGYPQSPFKRPDFEAMSFTTKMRLLPTQ
jgi:hypothetical protein